MLESVPLIWAVSVVENTESQIAYLTHSSLERYW